ncbi:MAG: acetyl-CoA carboxylase biotin carboxyl carrier protein subunit [Tannerella sp.]|jgi:biotin carboxyl carrier protein|nr:acetyl-CoA carboxylase biotin carboxyl carrier protein subunit [Tannerella sp.]
MKEFKYTINGNVYNVIINGIEDSVADVEVNGTSYKVEMEKVERKAAPAKRPAATTATPSAVSAAAAATTPPPAATGGASIKAPLPGIILSIDCKAGDVVKKGQKLLVLEAMKMENVISSDRDGEIADVKVSKGDSVLEGVEIVVFK